MRYRNPKKESDLFSMIDHQQSVINTVKGINKLNAVIDWELFREELESILGYSNRDPKRGGRPPFDAVLMLKVLVLQKYYGLSDEETEFQIMDRFSFLQFLGLQAGDDVPDARTIWDFKQSLEKDGRDGARRLFERFGQELRNEGLMAREGSIVDASFVDAPRQRNSREENAQIKKGERPDGFEADTPKGTTKGLRCALDKEELSKLHPVQGRAWASAQRRGASGQQTPQSDTRALRARLWTNGSDGDGQGANHRPGPSQSAQRTMQPRLQSGSICLPMPLRLKMSREIGSKAKIEALHGFRTRYV